MTSILHAILALVFQATIGLLTGNWWAGAAFGGAFYFGREVAQWEQKRLAYFGHRATTWKGNGMPWYEGFKFWNWNTDAKFDLLMPVAATCSLAYYLMTKGYV